MKKDSRKNYIIADFSTGTWLVLGVETGGPIINFDSMKLLFTNEGGVLRKNFFCQKLNWILDHTAMRRQVAKVKRQQDFLERN